MKLVVRSIRNVLRSPIRLILVVTLLGASLMFVAAMVSLDTSSQQQLAAVRKQIGTTISIEYAPQQSSGQGNDATPVSGSGPGSTSIVVVSPHISNSMVTKVKSTQGVVGTQTSLARPYLEETLKSLSTTLPPITMNGISKGFSDFTVA